jgi:hypothetical protein
MIPSLMVGLVIPLAFFRGLGRGDAVLPLLLLPPLLVVVGTGTPPVLMGPDPDLCSCGQKAARDMDSKQAQGHGP